MAMSLTLQAVAGWTASVSRSRSDLISMLVTGTRSVAVRTQVAAALVERRLRRARRSALRACGQRRGRLRGRRERSRARRRYRCRAGWRRPGPGSLLRRSRSMVAMRCTLAVRRLTGSSTVSPTRTVPEETVPARPRKSARVSRRTVCTGMRKAPTRFGAAARDLFQVLEQRRARVPGHVLGAFGDVVAGDGGDRNGDRFAEAEAPHQRAEIGFDLAEAAFRPVDEIHLVDGEDDALHADEIEDGGVAAGLRLDAVAGVDEHDGDVGVRGAGRHVARVLLVAGAVDDDEAAGRRCRSSARRCRW